MDYIYIDKEVLYSKDLSSTAKLLYIYLRKHSENGCCQSMTMEKMEEKLGISRKTISTAVKELSDNYFMKVESPGMNRQNIYRFPFLNDTNEIKADMEIIKDTTLSKSDKIIYLVISSSFNELSRQEIVDLTGISLSSVKTSVKSLCDKKMIIEETKGKKSVYKKTNIKDTTDTEDIIRQAVEKWLGIEYFTQSTSCFAEAARQIRDAVVNDQALKRKKDPPLFDIYCKDIYDSELIISAYISDKKHLNCNSFLREKARKKELKFFLKSDDKDSPKIKMCNSLKNTSYNYFFDHEKIMVYAKVKEIRDDCYVMSNLLDPAEEFRTEKNGITFNENDTCRLFLGHPDNEVYPLLYGEKMHLPNDLKLTGDIKIKDKGDIKIQEKDFLTLSSSKNKHKGEMKLKGIAFIRKYGLLLPYKTTLILTEDHFPEDYPLPKKGVMLNFDDPKKPSDEATNNYIPNYFVKKDGTNIFVDFIKFRMPTDESKKAFLRYIVGLENDPLKTKMCGSLRDTSYNYSFDQKMIIVYAKVKDICDDHYIMSNLLDPAEEFHTEKNGITFNADDTCRLILGHPDNEVYPLLYGEKMHLPSDLKSIEDIKFQDKDFLTLSSSKNKLKGEMKLKGIAVLREYNILLPYKTTLILTKDHFPEDYPLPKKGEMLNFDDPKKSSDKVTNNNDPDHFVKKDGINISVDFIELITPTPESKRAFLQYLEEDKASKLVKNGFPELSESNYDREKIKSIFADEKISLSASDVELYTDRCTMLTKPDELKKLFNEGFYCPPDDKLPKILANLLSNYSNYFIKKYSANTTNELQILLGKGIYKPLDDKSPKELAKSMTELLAKLLANYNYIHIKHIKKYSVDVVNELKELLDKGFSEPLDDKSPKLLVKLLAGLLAKLLAELLEEYYDILFNRYSIDALYKLKQNPYILLDDTDDTAPFVCDRIAKFLGMKYNEPVRLCSLIRYIFSSVLSGGDIGIYTNELTEKFAKYKDKVFDEYPNKEELLQVIVNDNNNFT